MLKKQRTWIILRRGIQIGVLVGLTILFVNQNYVRSSQPLFSWLGFMDPFAGIAAVVRDDWSWLLLLSIGTLLTAVLFGRIFCGWICPVGTVLDLSCYLKHWIKLKDRTPERKKLRLLTWIRWTFFGSISGFILARYSAVLFFNPLVIWPREINRVLNGLIPWSIIGLIVIGMITFPRFWCRFLCPTGSILNLASRLSKKRYTIKKGCKHCQKCIHECPMQNIVLKTTTHEMDQSSGQAGPDCLHCDQCVCSCPNSLIVKESTSPWKPTDEGRRDFLTSTGVGLASLSVAYFSPKLFPKSIVKTTGNNPRRWSRLMRPPGALAEESFVATCNRCGQCYQACPTKVLVPAGLEAGLAGIATPRFIPHRKPNPGRCVFCMACGQVCPTKALVPVPIESARLGTAEIHHERCVAWKKGIKCLLCVEICTKLAISMDSKGRPVIDKQKCNGCGSCEAHCPVEGSAVQLTNAGETRR